MAAGQTLLPIVLLDDRQMENILHHCREGNLDEVKKSLEHSSVRLTSDNSELTVQRVTVNDYILYSHPTVEAAAFGHHNIVDYLVRNFSEIIPAVDKWPRCCALHVAAEKGKQSVLKTLLDAGFLAELVDLDGNTPLLIAIRHRRVQVVKYLVLHGASVNSLPREKLSPLVACLSSRSRHVSPQEMEIVDFLLHSGLDLKLLARNNINPFREIMQGSNVAVEGELLHRLLTHDPHAVINFFLEPSFPGSNLPLALVASARGWDIKEVSECDHCPSTIGAEIVISIAVHKILAPPNYSEESVVCPEIVPGVGVYVAPSSEDNNLLWVALQNLDKIGIKFPFEGADTEFTDTQTQQDLIEMTQQAQKTRDPTKLFKFLIAIQKKIYGKGHVLVVVTLQRASKELARCMRLESADKMAVRILDELAGDVKLWPNIVNNLHHFRELVSIFFFLQGHIGVCQRNNFPHSYSTFVNLGVDMVVTANSYRYLTSKTDFFLSVQEVYQLLRTWSETVSEPLFFNMEIVERARKFFTIDSIIRIFRRLSISTDQTSNLLAVLLPLTPALDTMDLMGNRPLHFCAKYKRRDPYIHNNSSMIEAYPQLLVNMGAHLDAVDDMGKTAFECCVDRQYKDLLRPPTLTSLMCLASRAIVAGQIDYHNLDNLPPKLKQYISLHDPCAPQGIFSHSLF